MIMLIICSKYVMREIGIHQEDEVAVGQLQTVDVGRAKSQFSSSLMNNDLIRAKDFLEREVTNKAHEHTWS